jgi:hypothetical protein
VSRHLVKKKFKFTPVVFIRLIVFFIIICLSINFLSSTKKSKIIIDSTVLGDEIDTSNSTIIKDTINQIYKHLPLKSQETLNNLPSSPPMIYITDKLNYLKSETNGFPQKQINDLKKNIVKNALQSYLDSLDHSQ